MTRLQAQAVDPAKVKTRLRLQDKATGRSVAMNPYSMLRITVDSWRVGRGGPPAATSRQRARLAETVAFARERSPYFRKLYRGLPSQVSDLRLLPPVRKADLMDNFDEWVTDPDVTRGDLEAFVADPSLIGHEYLNRYMAWTTSGTTGTPAILVHDRRSLAVMSALSVTRVVPAWMSPGDLLEFLRRGGRAASVWATGGHFFGVSMDERQRRSRASRRRRDRKSVVQGKSVDVGGRSIIKKRKALPIQG